MQEDSTAEKAAKKATQKPKFKDIYQGQQEFVSRLFQLNPVKMLKKVVLGKGDETIQESTHDHFYRTVDSSGKFLDQSAATGGHFHVVEIYEDPETGEPKGRCSGPKTFTRNKKGRQILADLPPIGVDDSGNDVFDKHVHEVNYLRSSKIKPRSINPESVKIVEQEASKAARIDGIRG